MDWISVSAACSAASEAIARTSPIINTFVREVRESRSEFDSISTELHSLDGVLDLLGYDAAFFPLALADHTAAVLATCLALICELEGCISLLDRPDIARAEKKSRWLASRGHIDTLRWTLGQYKLVLGLAADLLGVSKSQINDGAERDLPDNQPESPRDDEAEDNEMAIVAARIAEVSSSLEKDLQQSVALARLGQYLRVLQTQTVSTGSYAESHLHTRRPKRTSSMGGAPDSAIDVSYDDLAGPTFRTGKQTTPPPSMTTPGVPWDEELDEFVGELSEMPIQAPPLPPRSSSRMSSGTVSRSPTQHSGTADFYSGRGSATTSPSWPRNPRLSISSLDGPQHPSHGSYFTPVTELTERIEDRPLRPETRTHSRRSSFFGPSLHPVWENPRADVPSPGRPTTTGYDTPQLDRQSSLLRRSGSKLSNTFRSLSLRRPALNAVDDDSGLGSNAVFGVPLTKSIQLAKGVASTRHGTGESSARATRDYPLSVLRCVYYIRDCGLDVPQLFGLDGDQVRVGQLKGLFNSTETSYGKDLEWSPFTVHDAAGVILLFLAELPKPVISESVGKRWISMSRQATIRGARLDQALDFWEEALMGVQGPGRALFKLLLNLWGDIADAAEANNMTAERLAGRVIGPLMHAAAARRQTDFMLGLAFLIRKRSEYNLVARGATRKSNAAF